MNALLRNSSHALLVLAGILLVIPVLPFLPAQAQTVDGQFLTQINAGAGTGGLDQLQVSVELAASPTFDLGTSTLMFFFNDAALAIPSNPSINEQLVAGTDYQFEDPFIGALGDGKFYGPSTVSVFGQANRLSANLVLEVTGAGQPLPEAMTPVVTLFFDITAPSQSAGLSWILPSSGDPNPTEVFLEDNVTAVTLGTFFDETTELPVELVAFEAVADGDGVQLQWETASETNNAGFEIEIGRLQAGLEAFAPWRTLAFVEGQGTTAKAQTYRYRVAGLEPGRYRFRLRQVDFDGSFAYSPEVEVAVAVPGDFVLSPAYPNPFNPQTRFSLGVARAQEVEVAVYDMLGRRVEVLFKGEMEAGSSRAFVWEAGSRPSGVYVIQVRGKRFLETRRVTLLK